MSFICDQEFELISFPQPCVRDWENLSGTTGGGAAGVRGDGRVRVVRNSGLGSG